MFDENFLIGRSVVTSATSKIYTFNIEKYKKFPLQHEHYVSCNIHRKICENNSCNIEDQLLKYTVAASNFSCRPDVCTLAFSKKKTKLPTEPTRMTVM